MQADEGGTVTTTRDPEAETVGRVLVGHVDAEGDYALRQASTQFPDDRVPAVSQTELPLALTRAEGVGIAERWLAEARVARDGASFALPPSRSDLGAGDVVNLNGQRYRIDRVEQAESLQIDAVRIEHAVYEPSDYAADQRVSRSFAAPMPVYPVFLDLPLLSGDEVPHAPHLAVAARPWPGAVAVWSSSQDAGYALNRTLAASATIGRTETVLSAARPGLWDRGQPLRVRLSTGQLSSATALDVLNGANVMAIGNPEQGVWEVFQFVTASLVAPRTYELSGRLRGQAGTDGIQPEEWPIGSQVVLLDRSLVQIDLPISARGMERHFRIGVGARGYEDPSVVHEKRAFDAVGLRPFAPAHLAVRGTSAGLSFSWIRRTRIDGDSWVAAEPPLGEDREAYVVSIWKDGTRRREVQVQAPLWEYSAGDQLADGVAGGFEFRVAQLSASFGVGPERGLTVSLPIQA